jgi:diguanylate cyclase (GGDEF)-like protein
MARQDVAKRASDRLGWLELHLRDHPAALPAAAAVVVAAAAGHHLLHAPALAWLSALALAVAALAVGEAAVMLTLGAIVLHGVVDVVAMPDVWPWQPLVRGVGMAAAAVTGAGTGVMLRRYEEARRRSRDEDSVTGLLNVRAFYDGLADLRVHATAYSILLADIAGMRNLNERYGHPTGTEAMRALGHVLRRATKRTDLVARLGSDEVAVALVGADRRGALAAARRLSRLLADETVVLPDGRRFRVHAYYGIASAADLPDDVALLRAADHAKLAAKQRGPDEIGIAGPEDETEIAPDEPLVSAPPSGVGTRGRSSAVAPRPAR